MIQLQYINAKQQSLIIGDDSDFALIDFTGITPPKANIQIQAIAGFDGATFVNASVNPRNLVLTLQLQGEVEANRQKLYDVFKIKQKGMLIYTSERIEAQIEAYVEALEIPPMSWPVKALISLLCPQPYFEALQDILTDISFIESTFTFPLQLTDLGVEMGIVVPSEAVNLYNPGDISVGMKIRYSANGEVVNPKLINTQTLTFIELQTTMLAGDVLTITTDVGKKRIERLRGGEVTNLFNALALGSTFLQLEEGDNVLYATSSSGSSSLFTEITFRPKYSGV